MVKKTNCINFRALSKKIRINMHMEFPICRLYLILNPTKKAKNDSKPEKHLESVVTVRILEKCNWECMQKYKI